MIMLEEIKGNRSKVKYIDNEGYSINKVKDICLSYKFKLLSSEYFGNQIPIDVEDENGYRGSMRLNDIQSGKKFLKYRKNNKFFFYNIRNYFKVHNYNCDIVEVNEFKRKQKFTFVCECGKKYNCTLDEVINSNKPRIRCMRCTNSMSNCELRVKDWLKSNYIKFETQKRFDDCKYKRSLPFDFYLPELNICIEVDGEFHYRKQPQVTEQQFEESKLRDHIKDEYCLDNNIKLIRIPYWEIYNNKYKETLKRNILV